MLLREAAAIVTSICNRQDKYMGGIGGEIRGKTREEIWWRFRDEVSPLVIDKFGLFLEAPLSEDAAFQSMRHESETDSWVLDYYFAK
jgi:hypothetical protein